MAAAREEIDGLRGQIGAKFPKYWAQRAPAVVTLAALTGQGVKPGPLAEDEALILISIPNYDEPRGLVFAVSRGGVAVGHVRENETRLVELTQKLRQQIQQPALSDEAGVHPTLAPFDRLAAWQLYDALLGDPALAPILARAKRLLFVTSDPLKEIPFGTLITAKPQGDPVARDAATLRSTRWLLREKAVSVFPSVSSLVALRMAAPRAPEPREPLLAFADPQFERAERGLPGDRKTRLFRSAEATATGYPVFRSLGRSGEEEMGRIAALLGAPRDAVLSGPAASEAAFKALARNGKLGKYHVLGFATHGLVPGDAENLQEPALALSVPTDTSEDGILRASEISALSISADVVLLSACNTGTLRQSRSLVGLSRAFLRAGSRAVIVTYWQVETDVGLRILPAMFAAAKADPKLSLAEALRAASLMMLDEGESDDAHPSRWAAYSLIGDGR
jgi:CHAT domain-containing protein